DGGYLDMSLPDAARFFVRLNPPRILVPRGAKKIGARIARDFTIFVSGTTEGYNSKHGTSLDRAEGLKKLLDLNVTPSSLLDEFHRFDGAPDLRKVLIEHPNGEKWLSSFVLAFRDFLYPNSPEGVGRPKTPMIKLAKQLEEQHSQDRD